MKLPRTLLAASAGIAASVVLGTSNGMAADKAASQQSYTCAVIEVASCEQASTCVKGPADRFNLPVFLRINLKDNVIESIREGDQRRTSPILGAETDAGVIVVRGKDGAATWVAAIQEDTGGMTASVLSEDAAFVIFGACTSL